MRILLTGAAGGVGARLRPMLRRRYPSLVLSDLAPPDNLQPGQTFIPTDLADPAAVARAVAGIDGVVHLGGHVVEGPWETILSANLSAAGILSNRRGSPASGASFSPRPIM